MIAYSLLAALSLTVTEVPRLTNPRLEALAAPTAALVANPELGDCGAVMKRVKANDLGDQILENAVNLYVSDLGAGENFAYDFGTLVTTSPGDASGTIADLAGDEASEATRAALSSLGTCVENALSQGDLVELKSGTAFYQKNQDTQDITERELALRVITDKVNNEFLLFGVGHCE